jgi:repressor LexA
MRRRLTKRQNQVFEFIKKFIEENHRPPTVREICREFNFSSTNSVHSIISSLEKKGYIRKERGVARGIAVPEDKLSTNGMYKDVKKIPLVSNFDANNPFMMLTNLDGTLKLDMQLANYESLFAVRVPDDGMERDGILKGDIAVVERKSEVRTGKIVFAIVENEGLIRYYKFENETIHLVPSNKSYDILKFPKDDPNLWIGGEVVLIIRKLGI